MTDGRITVTRGRGDWERTRGAFYILIWEAGTQVRAHVKTHRALTECMLALTRIKNKIAYDTDLVLKSVEALVTWFHSKKYHSAAYLHCALGGLFFKGFVYVVQSPVKWEINSEVQQSEKLTLNFSRVRNLLWPPVEWKRNFLSLKNQDFAIFFM